MGIAFRSEMGLILPGSDSLILRQLGSVFVVQATSHAASQPGCVDT